MSSGYNDEDHVEIELLFPLVNQRDKEDARDRVEDERDQRGEHDQQDEVDRQDAYEGDDAVLPLRDRGRPRIERTGLR